MTTALDYARQQVGNEYSQSAVGKQLNWLTGKGHEIERNIAAAEKQMAFQEHMSNTAYQRAVADMKAAGINPIAAVSQGGASSAQGASSGGGHDTGFAQFASSALSMLGGIAAKSLKIANTVGVSKNLSSAKSLLSALSQG